MKKFLGENDMNNLQILEWMVDNQDKVVVVFEPTIRDMKERWQSFMGECVEVGVFYRSNISNVTVSLNNGSTVIFTLPYPEKVMGLDSERTIFIDNTGKMPKQMMYKYTYLLK